MPQPQARVGWRSGASQQSVSSLLSVYSDAIIAYSFRKLRQDYSGPAVRIRRGGDNAELEFGFGASGSVDQEAILTWIGYPNRIIDYSENMSLGGGWAGSGYTKQTFTGTAGPGYGYPGLTAAISTINLLSETATNAGHATRYGIISGTVDRHNYSAYMKKGPGATSPDKMIVAIGNATYNAWAVFDLVQGQAVAYYSSPGASEVQVAIASAGDGWWRCSVGAKLGYSTSQSIQISVQFCNDSASYNPFTNVYLGSTSSSTWVTGHMWTNTSDLKRYGASGKSSGYNPGEGYVVKWYNQAQNSYVFGNKDFTVTSATSQPKIVALGELCAISGKTAMLFDGINDGAGPSDLVYPATSSYGEPVSQFAMVALDPAYSKSVSHAIFSHGSNNTFRFSVASDKYTLSSGGTALTSAVGATSSPMLVSAISSSTDSLRINGNTILSGNAGAVGPSGANLYLGRSYSGTHAKAYIAEYMMSLSDRGASASAIEDAMNSYWSSFTRLDVASGAQLVVDAAVAQSYPGSGTVFGDLSGSMLSSGTLTSYPAGTGFTASAGGGLTFNGTSQYVTFGTNRCKSDNFTLEAVFKIDALPTIPGTCNSPRHPIIGMQDWGYYMYMGTDGKITFQAFTTDGSGATVRTQASVVGQRCHVSVKKSGTAVSLYLNGAHQETANAPTSPIRWFYNTWPFVIGTGQCGSYNYFMGGTFHLARFYATPLTDAQILQNFNATKSRFGL